MTGPNDRRFCLKCLLRDLPDGEALAKTIEEWIHALPENRRIDEDNRQTRLSVCRTCDELRSGTCAQCGCYVEFRAAQRMQRCPLGRWE